MAKKGGLFSSVLFGVVGGAAAAYFLSTEKGKEVKKKVVDFAHDYKDNPEKINQEIIQKAQGFGQQASEKITEVRDQVVSGELTVDDIVASGKEKAQDLAALSKERIEEVRETIAAQNWTTADLLAVIRGQVNAETPAEPAEDQVFALPEAAVVDPAEDAVTQEDIEITL